MSPKPHVARQAVLLSAALGVLALVGYPILTLIVALIVLAVGVVYGLSYHKYRRRPFPPHRVTLDRFVVMLIGVGGLVPGIVGVALTLTGAPLHVDSASGGIWFAAAAFVFAVMFSSSLIDWYWILPRLGGLGEWPRPCTVEVPKDSHAWRFLTQFWYGHRLAAEFLCVGIVVAAAAFLAAAAEEAHRAIWVSVASACTLGAGIFIFHWYRIFGNVSNPDVIVGSVIRVARVNWHPEKRELYVVDVDLRGIQCMQINAERLALDGERAPAAAFRTKKETTAIKLDEHVDPLPTYRPPCADHCTGINWYCRFNPRAYEPN